jgi:hypothetical protein
VGVVLRLSLNLDICNGTGESILGGEFLEFGVEGFEGDFLVFGFDLFLLHVKLRKDKVGCLRIRIFRRTGIVYREGVTLICVFGIGRRRRARR